MSVLSDKTLKGYGSKLIVPFLPGQVKADLLGKLVSFGLSSYGYDLRLSDSEPVIVFDPVGVDVHGENPLRQGRNYPLKPVIRNQRAAFMLPAQSVVLLTTMEEIHVPDDCIGFLFGKSTYARCGLIANCPPLEPGWKGHPTICMINPLPTETPVYIGEGLVQAVFIRGDEPCETSYSKRGGKYQNTKETPVGPRL
jgi:dCTP deaminase